MYEVYALKYGERDTTMCQFFYREHRHEPLTLHYFVWLIMGGPHPVLVDTGFRDDDAQARGIKNYVSPGEVVERFGVKASEVPLCLISHLHYDHWAGHTLFPNAQFWIQKDEVAFWTGRHAGTPAFRGSANVPVARESRDAQLSGPHQDRRRRPRRAARHPRPQGGRPHRRPSDRERRDRARPGDPHVGRLALLPQHREPPARPDHHEPPRDARRLRDHRRARGQGAPRRRRPRPRGRRRGSRRRSRASSRSPEGDQTGGADGGSGHRSVRCGRYVGHDRGPRTATSACQ